MPGIYRRLHQLRAGNWLAEALCAVVFFLAVLSTAFQWG